MVLDGLNTSIIGRAAGKGLLSIEAVNIRDYTKEKHGHVDDTPYGGGAGMVMQAAGTDLQPEDCRGAGAGRRSGLPLRAL